MAHPIYIGFTLFCVGTAIATNSPGGLWVVCPTVAIGGAAFVLGAKRNEAGARRRETTTTPILHLPAAEDVPCSFSDRVSVYVLVILFWVVLYEAVQLLGLAGDSFETYFPNERNWRVIEWTELLYASFYVGMALVPIVARTRRDLRRFAIRGWVGSGIATLCYVVIPAIATPKTFVAQTGLGKFLSWERAHDSAAAAFPSSHVMWAFMAADFFAAQMPAWRVLPWLWAVAVAASCITTGMHSVLDVVAGLFTYLLVAHSAQIYRDLQSAAARLANSWRAWRTGPARIIGPGMFGGLAAAAGIAIGGRLLGPTHIAAVVITGLGGLVGAGAWAQWSEGTSARLRPFGYYGCLLGVLLGATIGHLTGTNIWLLLAAFSVAGPWISAVAQLRSLLQGFGHGRRSDNSADEPRLSIPIYSILWSILIGLLLARLWSIHAPLCLITGVYLILAGAGRLVEDAYRGEARSLVFGGLHLCQWLAIGCVLVGASVTVARDVTPWPDSGFSMATVAGAILLGLIGWFALGVGRLESGTSSSELT
jgi:membrane-associated phospholipid phosphatase